jgi:hypothetical protein
MGVRVILLLTPIGATIAAAIVRQYPFSDRLILFLVPHFFIAVAVSVDWLYHQAASWSEYVGWLLCIALLGPAAYPMVACLPAYRAEDMKPVMSHLEANWWPGDVTYLYYGASSAFTFYRMIMGFVMTTIRSGVAIVGKAVVTFRNSTRYAGGAFGWCGRMLCPSITSRRIL